LALWQSTAVLLGAFNLDLLQITCELIDERNQLRLSVLRGADPSERRALRALDRLLVDNLQSLAQLAEQASLDASTEETSPVDDLAAARAARRAAAKDRRRA